LTVGFGDLVPTTDAGRGIVFPYSVGGIITLALIVSSLYRAVRELSQENIVQRHTQHRRERALELTVTNSTELRHRERDHQMKRRRTFKPPRISGPSELRPFRTPMGNGVQRSSTFIAARKLNRAPQLILLKEERDRFNAMRRIQADSKKFKRWMALGWSVATFTTLWCVGAVIFWRAERTAQGLSYFQALYFCYISLLTIGYGDLAPKSNAGRCFFVIWSLVAVPTMTILVSDLGDTVVAKFKKWSSGLADFTVLPREGSWRAFLNAHPWLLDWLQRRIQHRRAKRRLQKGFDTADPDDPPDPAPVAAAADSNTAAADPESSLPALARKASLDLSPSTSPSPTHLSHRLAAAIQKTAHDLRSAPPKRYAYEEWVEFTRLIRLTTGAHLDRYFGGGGGRGGGDDEEADEDDGAGLVNWDWIGEDSPMVSGLSEAAWLLERLCESLVRLEKRRERAVVVVVGGHGDVPSYSGARTEY
jgi:potassium channel subfamily K